MTVVFSICIERESRECIVPFVTELMLIVTAEDDVMFMEYVVLPRLRLFSVQFSEFSTLMPFAWLEMLMFVVVVLTAAIFRAGDVLSCDINVKLLNVVPSAVMFRAVPEGHEIFVLSRSSPLNVIDFVMVGHSAYVFLNA